ncbi:hypothetical protein ACRALDRAFT_207832 [Sodiomyces alcalophilus JCM 7366]|uniref:uncharacterized protein n=1 Tax=Sodiomyces alcalophilus JCM 7366 TaxID=591952 RepID=UPI0039B3B3E0
MLEMRRRSNKFPPNKVHGGALPRQDCNMNEHIANLHITSTSQYHRVLGRNQPSVTGLTNPPREEESADLGERQPPLLDPERALTFSRPAHPGDSEKLLVCFTVSCAIRQMQQM